MKQAISLAIASTLNMSLVFLAQWYVLTQLGAGSGTDAYFASMVVPQIVLMVISSSLMHVLVPLLSGESEEVFARNAWGFVSLIALVFAVLTIALFVSAPRWVSALVPGFDAPQRALTVDLTRIQLLGMVFSAVNGVQWSCYHARQRFIMPELTPALASLLAFIALLWLLPSFGVEAAAWLNIGRALLQTIFLLPGMGRPKGLNFNRSTLHEAWKRIKPLLLGATYYKTDPLIDRILLSNSSSGSLSIYHLAQQIYSAANQIINKAFVAPLIPLLSNLHKAEKISDFKKVYRKNLQKIAAISLFSLMIFGIVGKELLVLTMGYGNYADSDVNQMWWIMIWLGGTLLGGALGQLSSSAYYAIGDTTTPTRLGMISYTIYIPVKVLAFYWLDIMGMAISTSGFLLINFYLQNSLINEVLCKQMVKQHDK